jgi:hypothetical protein
VTAWSQPGNCRRRAPDTSIGMPAAALQDFLPQRLADDLEVAAGNLIITGPR